MASIWDGGLHSVSSCAVAGSVSGDPEGLGVAPHAAA